MDKATRAPFVLNIGGEGERDDAIDLNSLVSTRRRPDSFVTAGRTIVGDFLRLPIRSGSVDEVWGRMVPLRLDLGQGDQLAAEAYRSLRPGGRFRVQPSLPSALLLPSLAAAGFVGPTVENGFAVGVRP